MLVWWKQNRGANRCWLREQAEAQPGQVEDIRPTCKQAAKEKNTRNYKPTTKFKDFNPLRAGRWRNPPQT